MGSVTHEESACLLYKAEYWCRPRSPLPEVHKPRSGSSSPRPVLSRFRSLSLSSSLSSVVSSDIRSVTKSVLMSIGRPPSSNHHIWYISSWWYFESRRQILASLEEELCGLSSSPLSSSPCPSSFSGSHPSSTSASSIITMSLWWSESSGGSDGVFSRSNLLQWIDGPSSPPR